MPTFYLDPALGNDLLGDGSLSAPFKSLEHVFGLDHVPGYELIESTVVYLQTGDYAVSESLVASGIAKLTIQNYPNAVVTITQSFADAPLFDLTEMDRFALIGPKIVSVQKAHEIIKLRNCNLSKITNVTLKDLTFSQSYDDFSFIRLINTATEISNLDVENILSPNDLKIVSADNASLVTVKDSRFAEITANALLRVICVEPNNLNVTLQNLSFSALHANDAYAVYADFAGTATQFLLDNFAVYGAEFGVFLKNNPEVHQGLVKVRRGEISHAHYGITCDAASCQVYNSVLAKSDFGLMAKTNSHVDTYNNIFYAIKDYDSFGNTAAIRAQDSSEVKVSYSAFYDNTTIYQEASNGSILKNEYIRFINPQFTDAAGGDYALLDTSPLVDVGRPVDYDIAGAAADIGKYDVDRLVPSEEVPLVAMKLITRTYRAYDLGQIDVQALIGQIMQQIDPNMIPREGSAINDLLVKPHAILYQRILDAVMLITRNQSLMSADFMTSQELDAFAANQYVVRSAGTLAYVTARVYFQQPVNVVISPQDIFVASTGLRFYPRQYVSLTSGEMSGNIEGTLYFVDVPLEAETFGTEYNIASGAINEWAGAPSVAISVTNLSDAYPGSGEEANDELIARIKKSIGNRTLIHDVGINAILPENFPEVKRTVSIGAGDPEMIRDIFYNQHFFGKTDVYLSGTELALARFDILDAQLATVLSRTTIGDVPIIDFVELRVLDPDTAEPTDTLVPSNKWSVAVGVSDDRYSIEEVLTLNLHADYVGNDLRLTFKWSPEILSVNNFASSPDQRVLCESFRPKHMVPCFLNMQINYKSVIELDEAAIIAAIESFINLFPALEEFQVSDIIDIMYSYSADFVEQPLTVEARLLHASGTNETQYFINTKTLPRIYGYLAGNITLQRLD